MSIKYYKTLTDIWFKLLSNLVSQKIWILAISSFMLREGLISGVQWMTVVGALFFAREIAKTVIPTFKQTTAPSIEE